MAAPSASKPLFATRSGIGSRSALLCRDWPRYDPDEADRAFPLCADWTLRGLMDVLTGSGFGVRSVLLPLLASLAFLCPSVAGVASAGVNTWTTNGPEGGNVLAFAFDPTNAGTIYAVTST